MYANWNVIGGFSSGAFWSSSEYDDDDAWFNGLANGDQNNYNKANPGYVRPVRAF